MWTQLLNNSWIFYAPQVDVTILCHDNNPLDIRLQGIGKLQLHPGCTGYSPHTLLYGNTAVGNTSLQLEGDFLLQLDLNNVCCEELRAKLNSYQTSIDIAYQKTTSHLEDLRSASTGVSELIRKVDEQHWKNHYVTHHSSYSVLLILVVIVGSIYLTFRLYNFTRGWKPFFWHKQEVITTPTDVVSGIELQNQEHNAHPFDTLNEDSAPTAKPASQVPPRALTTCAANLTLLSASECPPFEV
jgi:hypothetical protein